MTVLNPLPTTNVLNGGKDNANKMENIATDSNLKFKCAKILNANEVRCFFLRCYFGDF